MANTLHIVKSAGIVHPWDVLSRGMTTDRCTIVLIQDGVTSRHPVSCPIFALARDAKTRGVRDTPHPLIEDDRFLELIWAADRVVVW